MRVHLTSFVHDPAHSPVVAAFNAIAAAPGADLRGHAIVDDAAVADCILFVDAHLCADPKLAALSRHPLARRFADRTLVYDERDEPWCAMPGVYVSMPREHFDDRRQRAFAYYASAGGTDVDPAAAPDLLYSFIGSPGHRTSGGHRVRRALLALDDPRGLVEDSSGFVFYDDRGDPAAHRARQRRFGETLARSKFVLCPRGRGTSSIRMYETLRAGRVPVVLADEWVAPDGPAWDACSLSVREADAGNLPEVLAAAEPRWPAMSAAARQAYEEWFAPRVVLGRLFDLCDSLARAPAGPVPRWRDPAYRAMRRRAVVQTGRTIAGRTLKAVGLK